MQWALFNIFFVLSLYYALSSTAQIVGLLYLTLLVVYLCRRATPGQPITACLCVRRCVHHTYLTRLSTPHEGVDTQHLFSVCLMPSLVSPCHSSMLNRLNPNQYFDSWPCVSLLSLGSCSFFMSCEITLPTEMENWQSFSTICLQIWVFSSWWCIAHRSLVPSFFSVPSTWFAWKCVPRTGNEWMLQKCVINTQYIPQSPTQYSVLTIMPGDWILSGLLEP